MVLPNGWYWLYRYLLGFSGNRGGRILFASFPILQIALQYALVHRSLDGRWPIGVGLHTVNGAVMPIVSTTLAFGWPGGRTCPRSAKAA